MNITIPPAALEAGAKTLCNEQRLFWHGLRSEAQDIIRREVRAVFIAVIEAWEETQHDNYVSCVILPLTEKTDD